MKRIISFFICFVIVLQLVPNTIVNAVPKSLEDVNSEYQGLGMPFRPMNQYSSMQNPPDFTWPYIADAIYELKICTDAAMKNVAYEKKDLSKNFYSFSMPFEAGTNYYWSVRYKKSGEESAWSDPRRFRIEPDASIFTVPDENTLLARVPAGHPRVFTTRNSLESFRAMKDTNETSKNVYQHYMKWAKVYTAANDFPDEPVSDSDAGSNARKLMHQMQTCAFAYLLSGDESVGRFGVKAALALSSWDCKEGSVTAKDDQINREITYKTAMAYDWLYNLMTESERKTVKEMVIGRLKREMVPIIYGLPIRPFDSHRWTIIAYIGIVSYVFARDTDVPEAAKWFKDSVSFYATMMPPWSYQDGGWSQGSYYWGISTIESTKEISDVLLLGGVIDLYKKAVAQNEKLWTMYTYPKGSRGSFGDGSGSILAENLIYIKDSMYELAHFNKDGLALWSAQDIGETRGTSIWDYYTGNVSDIEVCQPDQMPLGHCFQDVGWVAMTDSLQNPDRIHMTFKSSPYGSYNHSHADQNSFVIQAFGENLASKSGYYDSYNTSHDKNFTRQSFAHNTITLDGGSGQTIHNINAKGSISEYVNHIDFDSVTGKAEEAYMGLLDKFDRTVLYLRPNVYIVIDDLKSAGSNQTQFEWNLNSEQNIEIPNGESNKALVSGKKSHLGVEVVYPKVTSKISCDFINPIDGKEYLPEGEYANQKPQNRITFQTEKKNKTKMITVMNVYANEESTAEVKTETYGDYLKITCKDKSVYVGLNDHHVVTEDGFEFSAAALTCNDSSIMLSNGTYLKYHGNMILESENDVTVAMGKSEISMSASEDFELKVANANGYFDQIHSCDLYDAKDRKVAPELGIQYRQYWDKTLFSAQKGNYALVDKGNGVISPCQLKAEDVEVRNSTDGRAAVIWNMKPSRTYDIKIGEKVYYNAESPFCFPIEGAAQSIRVREKIGDTLGAWSDEKYVSTYQSNVIGNIKFDEFNVGGLHYIKASAVTPDVFGEKKILLCALNKDNCLIRCAFSQPSENGLEAVIEKTADTSVVRAFSLDEQNAPLSVIAEYSINTTDLQGIYVDGNLIDDFSAEKDQYIVYRDGTEESFPALSAEVTDATTKTAIDYDFENDEAKIIVTSHDGDERIIRIFFKAESNISRHYVKNADQETDFTVDSYVDADAEGMQAQKSKVTVGELSFDENGKNQKQYYPIYTNFKGYEGGLSGARVYSDRAPNSGNKLEIENAPASLKGSDYFVFSYQNFYLNNAAMKNASFRFQLSKAAEVNIITNRRLTYLSESGYEEQSTSVNGRYMNPIGAEDKYFNICFLGKSESELSGSYIKNYDDMESWIDVEPLPGLSGNSFYDTYDLYLSAKPGISRFNTWGSMSKLITRTDMYLSRLYRKQFGAGDVEIDLSDIASSNDCVVILIKDKTPKQF